MIQDLVLLSKPELKKGSLEERYYKHLVEGGSDADALKLFNSEAHQRVIKSSLRKKIIASLATKSSKTNHINADNLTYVNQLYTAAKRLVDIQEFEEGVRLYESCYKLSLKTEQLSIALESARYLMQYYCAVMGDLKKYHHYQDCVNKLLDRYNNEIVAQGYYLEVSYNFKNKWSEDIVVKAMSYCSITEHMIGSSIKTAGYHFNTLALALISGHSWEELCELCNKAIEHFNAHEIPARGVIKEFLVKQTVGFIKLMKYNKALANVDKIIGLSNKGTYSYCTALFYRSIIGLHSNDTSLSTDSILQAKTYLKKLPNNFQEQWQIVIAYAALFHEDKFRINKFLNEVPLFEKDKAGANASILIAQMLHALKTGGVKGQNVYTSRCDALQDYSRRYLKGRTKTFVKMLIEVQRGHFNKLNVEYRVKKHLKELQSQSMEIEVLPFEACWDMVMDWLD